MDVIEIVIIVVLVVMVVIFAVLAIVKSSQLAKAYKLVDELSLTNTGLSSDLAAFDEHRSRFIKEIDLRDYELMRNEISMSILTKIPKLLLDAKTEQDFDTAVTKSLKMMAEFVDVDRVRVWHNYKQDDVWVGTEIYEWTGKNAQRLIGSECAIHSEFEEVIPHYARALEAGESINAAVCNMSPAEQKFHGELGIQSLIEVPILMHEGFWGSIIFDDCHSSRHFCSEDEDFLRSGTLVLAYAITSKRHKGHTYLEASIAD